MMHPQNTSPPAPPPQLSGSEHGTEEATESSNAGFTKQICCFTEKLSLQ